MKPKLISVTLLIVLLTATLFSCKKEELLPIPSKPGSQQPVPGKNPGPPSQPTPAVLKIFVKASIKVGNIDYDSIPSKLLIKYWDSTGAFGEKQLTLQPGTNQLELPANTAKVYLKMNQWAVQDEKTIERDVLNQGQTIVLKASKQARKLKEEASFYLAQGNYYPDGRTEYHYNKDGSLFGIRFFRKEVEHQELKHHLTDRFFYTNGRLSEIKRYDLTPNGKPGITRISYNAAGKISEMFQDSYGITTTARFEMGTNSVSIYHSYNNGHSMTYNMEFAGGNKIKEQATTSRGGGEGGTFQYDHQINPFAHMNYPDLLLSRLSKNNVTGQQKGFAGAIPSLVPYKWEYTYDEDGYPVQLLKHFKSGATGEHISTRKIVYIYEN